MKKYILHIFLIYSSFCISQNTSIPDNNFEQALIDLGYDSEPLDNLVPTDSIRTITTLNVSNKSITNLTGIEDFKELAVLNCSENMLANIDVSENVHLEFLSVSENNLISLDVSNNVEIKTLLLSFNQIEDINLTNNLNLETLQCWKNKLTGLDLSNNKELELLFFPENQIKNIDLSKNLKLVSIFCDYNRLEALDLSNNIALKTIVAYYNNLQNLNIRNGFNSSIDSVNFLVYGNPNLVCIQVDNVQYSKNNWTNIDPHTSFSEDCSVLSMDNFDKMMLNVYPNPVNDHLYLSSDIYGTFSLSNALGKNLNSGKIQSGVNKINVSNLAKGIYFFSMRGDNGFSRTKKIIKF